MPFLFDKKVKICIIALMKRGVLWVWNRNYYYMVYKTFVLTQGLIVLRKERE